MNTFTKLFLATIILCTSQIYAADTNSKMDAIMPLGLSGTMFLETKMETQVAGKEQTTFALTRIFLNYKRNLWGPFSFKITSDIAPGLKSSSDNDIEDSTGTSTENSITTGSERYEFFVKNAYIQADHSWELIGINAKFGVIPTIPSLITRKLNGLRWTYHEYSFDKPSSVGVVSGDTTADLGFSVEFRILKLIKLTYSVCNGEGFKHPKEEYDGKAHYGTITIMPLDTIHINGYVNHEKDEATKSFFYYGGGAAYKSKDLKIGTNFIIHGVKDTGSKAQRYHVVEAWINLLLTRFVADMPVIIAGRFAYGKPVETVIDAKTLVAGGVGYKFNKHFRALAYYESYKRKSEAGASAFYIKSEAKF